MSNDDKPTMIERRKTPRRARAAEAPDPLDARRFDQGPQHWFHAELNAFNRQRLSLGLPTADWEANLDRAVAMAKKECFFIEGERQLVAARAATVPRDAAGLVEWFLELRATGPGQGDPLFPFLAERATFEQVRWFVKQEVAGEAGFEDLVAMTQVKMPERAKLEMARNYWDEMGRGKPPAMHGPLLANLARALSIGDTPVAELAWEPLALANTMVGLAVHRQYAYHSVGALGVIELTAPTRATFVAEAIERVGLGRAASHYFRLHAAVDIGHAREWIKEILAPLVEGDPALAVPIAEGALLRLNAGALTFDKYREVLGVDAPRARMS
ncbi:MAG: iron-containing redox enzyme family protein [Planctomycetota bacterium]|nr:iron-containing redox enzyme family protein [Planctomycetota bacterium]